MWAVLGGWLLGGCAAVGQLDELPAGQYRLVETNDPALRLARNSRYVEQAGDTLHFLADDSATAPVLYRLQPRRHAVLLARRFDLDVFTIPFKIRPARAPLPIQLNTNFNAALYYGRRLDFYHLTSRRSATGRTTPYIRTTGIGYGLFTGLGAAVINPDVTRQQTAVAEYEGLVAHAGAAFIYDAHIFNIGLAIGADHLFGTDRRYWIYQHKPWVGVLFGLDLN
ncbi:hypothetical protein GCM10027048_10100 [Hymenobacter coalescens]